MSVLTSWRNKRTWYLASYDKNLPFHEATYKQLMMNVEDQLTKLMKALNSPQFRGKVEVYCPNLDGIVHPFFYYLHILMLFQTCMLFSPLSTEIKKCHSFLYSFFFFLPPFLSWWVYSDYNCQAPNGQKMYSRNSVLSISCWFGSCRSEYALGVSCQ